MALLPACVLADSVGLPDSSETFSADQKLVFVSLVPYANGRSELNDKYPRSGLYRVGDPRKPVWAFDGGGAVEVSADSKHAVFWGPWPNIGDNGTTDALYFVREGKIVRTYQIKDLVKGPMPRSVSHYTWSKTSRLDETNGTFLVTVYAGPDGSEGATYVFDLATGEIIRRRIPLSRRIPLWGWAAMGGCLILVVITAVVFRSHPRRRTNRLAIVDDD